MHFMATSREKSWIFDEMVSYLHKKNCAFKVNEHQEKIIIQQLISNFADLGRRITCLFKMIEVLKNVSCKKFYCSVTSQKN